MKNKFDINSEEIKRILSLHEDATKNQYLNVISEIGAGGEGDSNFFNPKPTTNNPQSSQNKTIKYKNGDIYSGDYKNGKLEGKGTYIDKNIAIYSGDWRNDKREGKGTVKYKDGTYYSGDWKNGEYEGKGTYQNILNVKFYGDWEGYKFNCNGKKVDTDYLDKLKTNTCNQQQQVQQQNQQGQVQQNQQGQIQQVQQRRQQFIQQVTTNNKLIQTSLGVQQPTGQITTMDIDVIMKKIS